MFYLYFGVGDHPRQRGINYGCRGRSGGTNFGGGPLTAWHVSNHVIRASPKRGLRFPSVGTIVPSFCLLQRAGWIILCQGWVLKRHLWRAKLYIFSMLRENQLILYIKHVASRFWRIVFWYICSSSVTSETIIIMISPGWSFSGICSRLPCACTSTWKGKWAKS